MYMLTTRDRNKRIDASHFPSYEFAIVHHYQDESDCLIFPFLDTDSIYGL